MGEIGCGHVVGYPLLWCPACVSALRERLAETEHDRDRARMAHEDAEGALGLSRAEVARLREALQCLAEFNPKTLAELDLYPRYVHESAKRALADPPALAGRKDSP